METHYHFGVTAPVIVMFAMLFWSLALFSVLAGVPWEITLTVVGVLFVACSITTFVLVQALHPVKSY